MIRAFIAVELPDSVRQEVASLQADFKSSGADVKWVDPENLHLTLKFLGDIEESQTAALKEALGAGIGGLTPLDIHLEGIGAFPKTTFPRVIWVGVNQGEKQLVELGEKAEQACVGLGFPREERPFSAHLTIGRVRSKDRLAPLIKKLQVAEFRATAPAPVTKIILFQSTLSPKGPIYTPLAEFPLER